MPPSHTLVISSHLRLWPPCKCRVWCVGFSEYTIQYNTMINLYSATIWNAEALGGNNVLHGAAKKVSFRSLFKSCQGVRVDDIVRQWVTNGRCSEKESRPTAGKNCSSSRNGQPRCVAWPQWSRGDVWYEKWLKVRWCRRRSSLVAYSCQSVSNTQTHG